MFIVKGCADISYLDPHILISALELIWMLHTVFVQGVWATNTSSNGDRPWDHQSCDGEGVLLCIYQSQGERFFFFQMSCHQRLLLYCHITQVWEVPCISLQEKLRNVQFFCFVWLTAFQEVEQKQEGLFYLNKNTINL